MREIILSIVATMFEIGPWVTVVPYKCIQAEISGNIANLQYLGQENNFAVAFVYQV